MPELPEVEIARRQLERWASGRRVDGLRVVDEAAIRAVRSTRPRDAHPDGVSALGSRLIGKVAGVPIRVGKRLGWTFEGAGGIQIHLGMTGQWVRRAVDDDPPRFARLGLVFGDVVLWFVDARRFGCVVPVDAVADSLGDGLGPDAWRQPLTGPELGERLRGRRAIKVALLDQAVLAGVGNIHAVEALWRAGIHPGKPCGTLAEDELERLAEVIPLQLAESIESQDTDEFQYLTQGGDNPFSIYGRGGEPCLVCGTAIAQDRMGGRVTSWCPACQPASA